MNARKATTKQKQTRRQSAPRQKPLHKHGPQKGVWTPPRPPITTAEAAQIDAILAPYPDPMSRSQFRDACCIGSRTSLYLIQSGLVPCIHTGKKTRCYKIAKADVAEYLLRRAADPAYYTPPSGWYTGHPARRPPSAPVLHCIALDEPTRAAVLILYEKELEAYPDLLSVKDIAALTGYKPHTVARWCTEGKLKPLVRRPKCLIPKLWLVAFLASDEYNDIVRKSEKHYEMIARATANKQ